MKFALFERVVLQIDMPEASLRWGDVATVVEHHPVADSEDGYSLEVFNGLGETLAVVAVAESELAPLTERDVLHVRRLAVR